MYSASSEFHTAVAAGNPQKCLLIFEGNGKNSSQAVFTNDDIDVSRGIEFRDYFNLEEDIAIGQATSNEISFSLFNDTGLLNSFRFGDFLATLGVLLSENNYQQIDGVKVVTTKATWTGTDVYPYVKRDNVATKAQPSFAVRSILAYNGIVYVFSANGDMAAYDDSTGANLTDSVPKLNSFMKAKIRTYWLNKGMFYNKNNRRLYIYESGVRQIYEFVPLGYFTAERPKAPDVIEIDMTCNDYMVKFDEDMPTTKELGITYPSTFKNLLTKICDHVGVEKGFGNFINYDAKLSAAPKDFESATMRDVIKWISEAAAGNARINRDGKLVIDWLRSTSQTLDEGSYESFNPYYYSTREISQVVNRGSDGSYDKTNGSKKSGYEVYLIQDNPLLKGVS